MRKHFKTTGIVLRKVDFNEADRIVTLLTADRGKIDCIAKGARRFKSKFCGRLELLNTVRVECFEGRSLAILNEADVLSRVPDGSDYRILFYLSEITHKLIQNDQQVDGVYELLSDTLELAGRTAKQEVLLHAYLSKLLTRAGFLSPWNQCATCDAPLDQRQPIFLSLTDANTVCAVCRQPGDRTLTLGFVKWVNFMQNYPLSDALKVAVPATDHGAVWGWLEGVTQSLLTGPVKSGEFLKVWSG